MLCKMALGGPVKIRLDMLSNRPHHMTNYQLQGADGCYESARASGEANEIGKPTSECRQRMNRG